MLNAVKPRQFSAATTMIRRRGISLARMSTPRHWIARSGAALFALALLYPFTALLARIGPWQWVTTYAPRARFRRVSLVLTGFAMLIIVARGHAVAAYIARCSTANAYGGRLSCWCPFCCPPLALASCSHWPSALTELWEQRWSISVCA